jgi:glycosyltransferase involved in cell wall biosynthesis
MILYLGNNLTRHGNTPSSIETLGILLSSRYFVIRASAKRNQLWRGMDMMYQIVLHHRTITTVLMDTYSSLGFYYILGGACLCSLLSIPYIPILRGGNLNERLKRNPVLSKFIFKNAHVLIAPSNYLYTSFHNFGFKNIQYIPNSIELELYKMKDRKLVSARLLWVRSFHNVYNPMMAIEVLQKLLLHFPDVELCMVGPDKDGSLERCREFVQLNKLSGKVKFTGVLPKIEWLNLSQNYDIFINTTTIDNTPVSVIEAMALGLPVVSTNVGGIPFLITDTKNGFLVDSGDIDAMVNKIIWLAEHPDSAFQAASDARRTVEEFDWGLIKYKWFDILDEFEKPLIAKEA